MKRDREPLKRLGESVVEEVRAIREAIDEEVGHDVARLVERARRVSEDVRRRYGMKVAEFPPAEVPCSRRGISTGGHVPPTCVDHAN